MNDTLRNLGKDELVELLEIYAKNLIALDGTWFQSWPLWNLAVSPAVSAVPPRTLAKICIRSLSV